MNSTSRCLRQSPMQFCMVGASRGDAWGRGLLPGSGDIGLALSNYSSGLGGLSLFSLFLFV